MSTTITVNGQGGSRFLEFLGAKWSGPMPSVLAHLVDGSADSVEVEADLAEQVADFVDQLLADGIAPFDASEPPLLFSPNVGDGVAIVRDVLLEFQPPARRAPRIWRFVPRGTRGRVLAHQGDTDRVLLEPTREVAYVRPRCMTKVGFLARHR